MENVNDVNFDEISRLEFRTSIWNTIYINDMPEVKEYIEEKINNNEEITLWELRDKFDLWEAEPIYDTEEDTGDLEIMAGGKNIYSNYVPANLNPPLSDEEVYLEF